MNQPMALMVTGAELDGTLTNVRVDGGVITAIGAEVAGEPGDEHLDARGMAMIAGFVNAHGHAAMTLFRGYGSDRQLQEWLEMIWPAEARLTGEDVYWGTRLATIEMIRSGTTHFYDMYWHPGDAARAAQDAGIRATVGAPLFDGGDASALPMLQDSAMSSLESLAACGDLITPSLTPHSPYTVSSESLAFVAELAADRDLIVHTHLSETRREVADWLVHHADRPTYELDRLGLLGPRTLLAHGCQLDHDELELIAERGATIVTNPVSNLKLAGSDVFPYPEAAACGVSIGIGTDGASSNNSLDLLSDLKVFALIQKHTATDPTVLPAAEVLAIGQGRHSPILTSGRLEVGAPADFLLIDTARPEMNPGTLEDNLVYAGSSAAVDSTVIAGRVVMRHRVVDDEDEVIAQVRERSARITAG